MNARHPGYFGPTSNPCADAARWEDEQEHRAATAESREIEAGRIVLAEVEAVKPSEWSKYTISAARMFSADELLVNAVEEDDDTATAFAELMTSDAAKKVRELMAMHHAKSYWRDIAGLPDDELDDV